MLFGLSGHSGLYPREAARLQGVERYNGLWHETVWPRYRCRTLWQLQDHSRAFQEASHASLRRRVIRQGKGARLETGVRSLPTRLRVRHPLPLCRGQSWFVRSLDEDGTIQVLTEPVRLSKQDAHQFVRVVIRTGPQTLSVDWRPSPDGKFTRMAHRAYTLQENATTPIY
jgi:hypothetical protein